MRGEEICAKFHAALGKLLRQAGDDGPIREVRPVSGGDISAAARVETGNGIYFVKWKQNVPHDFFRKEAEGLQRLAEADALPVPRVLGHLSPSDGQPGMVLLEWIERDRAADEDLASERLGEGLAALHRMHGKAFGLEADNYIGRLPQRNGWKENWAEFYRDKRLGVLAELAAQEGRMDVTRARRMELLLSQLDRWLGGRDVAPSLLHGDLWRGNWLVGPQGRPYLIDPAVSYGDRELELAFTELFGGFSARFYRAYRASYPLAAGYEERKPLYQLYYLLVHLVLFGEAYGPSVDRILRRYVG
ncbi:fructosamine kinase family protein [Bacillaceae bacterium]